MLHSVRLPLAFTYFDLREIFECAHLKFTVSGQSKQTHTRMWAMKSRYCEARSGSQLKNMRIAWITFILSQDMAFQNETLSTILT